MGLSLAACRQAGRTNPGPSATARGVGNAGPDEEGWQMVQRKGNRAAQPGQGRRGAHTGAGRRLSRPPNGGNRARSASRAPQSNQNCPQHVPNNTEQLPGVATGAGSTKQAPVLGDTAAPSGRAWGAIPRDIHNTHTYIPSPALFSTEEGAHTDPLLEERRVTTQPPPPPHAEIATHPAAGVMEDVNDAESEASTSDDHLSDFPSHVSDSMATARTNLEEPVTLINVQQEVQNCTTADQANDTTSEATVSASIPTTSATSSSDWTLEKEKNTNANNSNTNGKKGRAGAATRRSTRRR